MNHHHHILRVGLLLYLWKSDREVHHEKYTHCVTVVYVDMIAHGYKYHSQGG